MSHSTQRSDAGGPSVAASRGASGDVASADLTEDEIFALPIALSIDEIFGGGMEELDVYDGPQDDSDLEDVYGPEGPDLEAFFQSMLLYSLNAEEYMHSGGAIHQTSDDVDIVRPLLHAPSVNDTQFEDLKRHDDVVQERTRRPARQVCKCGSGDAGAQANRKRKQNPVPPALPARNPSPAPVPIAQRSPLQTYTSVLKHPFRIPVSGVTSAARSFDIYPIQNRVDLGAARGVRQVLQPPLEPAPAPTVNHMYWNQQIDPWGIPVPNSFFKWHPHSTTMPGLPSMYSTSTLKTTSRIGLFDDRFSAGNL